MIRRLNKYTLDPRWFVQRSGRFVVDWIGSRRWQCLAFGMPAILCSVLLVSASFIVQTESYRSTLSRRYFDQGMKRLTGGSAAQAERCFQRSAELAANRKAIRFAAAAEFLRHKEAARGLEILETLAPLSNRGYLPAHDLQASYYDSLTPETDVAKAKALYHKIHAAGYDHEEEPRQHLAEFLSLRGHHKRAIDCLREIQSPSPESRIGLATAYTRAGLPLQAEDECRVARKLLETSLQQSPADQNVRIQLSRVLVLQHRPLDAVYLLVEGCQSDSSPLLVDAILRCYVAWLSQMSPQIQVQQIHDLATLFQHDQTPVNVRESREFQLSDGQTVRLPAPVAELHQRLLLPEGRWLFHFLAGTELASRGHWEAAMESLQQANEFSGGHPFVLNNLAFAMLKQCETADSADQSDKVTSPALTSGSDARVLSLWDAENYATRAINGCPHVAAFRETRGQIAAARRQWAAAIADLEASVRMGYSTPQLHATLDKVRRHSQQPSPSSE